MGNQASDGAYFSRPPAASLLARLTLDVATQDRTQDLNWTRQETWQEHRTVDLACGSGTLIAAMLTDMKRRAGKQGADQQSLAQLQKLAVEKVIAGLDFNPVSLQLAAAQLTTGNSDVAYQKMGLHRMPYGPVKDGMARDGVAVGSLALLGQSAIVPREGQMDVGDARLGSVQMQMAADDPLLENAIEDVRDVRIVIMNPPFTNRVKMGEKFQKEVKEKMRKVTDELNSRLVATDPEMEGFTDKNSIGPLFVALADRCLDPDEGVLAMINPTIALTATSGKKERIVLAKRFHIHTLLTCHQPGQVNLSQNTAINESMIIAKRHEGPRPPTRIISLDRLPLEEAEVAALHKCLVSCKKGILSDGWGEISEWPAVRIEAGDWTAAAFRSPELAEAAERIANDETMSRLIDLKMEPAATGQQLRNKDKYAASSKETPESFPIIKSKGVDSQLYIRAIPDKYWITKKLALNSLLNQKKKPETVNILNKASYLLITAGQSTGTARFTAVASANKYIGYSWMPISNITEEQAAAAAVFLNSTVGRLQFLRNPGKSLAFPTYSAKETANIRVPDLRDERICTILFDCWRATANMVVPQFRDGECDIRCIWDKAVADVLGWDSDEITEMRKLLHDEPHVRGLGREQYG